jgi:hypothetical protein
MFTGYLNARVMAIFRTSEVYQVALTDSLLDNNGLNLSSNDILPGNDHSFDLFTIFHIVIHRFLFLS